MRKIPTYGDKRDYPKISIFVNGTYRATTTWAKTCKQAVEKFKEDSPNYIQLGCKITAHFADRQGSK